MKIVQKISVVLLLLLLNNWQASYAQDRFVAIEKKLEELRKDVPGLDDKVELSVNGVSIQDFIRGLAASNNLNVSVDPALTGKIFNNFSNVTVSEVLIFLCRKYDLDVNFIGSIMSFSQYVPPPKEAPKYVPKQLKISYDSLTNYLSFDFFNDTLSAVAKELTRLTGRNMIIAPDLGNKLVSGFIRNLPLNEALAKLAFANELVITPSDNDRNYLIEKPGKTTQNNKNNGGANAPMPNGLNITLEGNNLVSVDAYNVPIADVLNAVSEKMHFNYFLFSSPAGNTTVTIANASYDEFLEYLLNGTDYTFKKENDVYLIGERNLERLRSTKVFQFRYRTLEKVIDLIPTELKKNVEIKAFPDQNSLVLSGSEPKINEIMSFLLEIDRLVPMVVIEVIIVDVSNSKTVSTGITAGLGNKPVSTTGTVFPGIDLTLNSSTLNEVISGINGLGILNLGNVTPNFYLTLKALETEGVLKLHSTPKLATLNGSTAKLSIGKTEYYLEKQSSTVGVQNPFPITTENYKSVTADLSLTITPIVSGDEQITLEIDV
ncbi:MAG TPA: hypothetical protein VI112_16905, partial [Bacteroidia bacterium]